MIFEIIANHGINGRQHAGAYCIWRLTFILGRHFTARDSIANPLSVLDSSQECFTRSKQTQIKLRFRRLTAMTPETELLHRRSEFVSGKRRAL